MDKLTKAVDYDKRPDLRPGFWPNYEEPTELGRLIQMPLQPADRWANGIINWYLAQSKPALASQKKGDGRETP